MMRRWTALRPVLLAVLVMAFALCASAQEQSRIIRFDPALDAIIAPDTKPEKLADGFGFLEGPTWVRNGGYLIFSDIPANVINKWDPKEGKVSVFLEKSGFTGSDPTGIGSEQTNGKDTFYLIGSNGITVDPEGRVTFCAMGDRQIVRLEKDGRRTVLAHRYEGKLLNGTNDLVFKRNGSLYFADPPSGLRGRDKSPQKELPYNGIFLLKDGQLELLSSDMENPNGLALSPDEKYMYVVDLAKRLIWRFDVKPDDTWENRELFADMTADPGIGNPDGIKVDERGNVYATGPGGLWIFSPEGKHLGTLVFPERPANLAFGDDDGRTIYVTARTGLYKIRGKIPGVLP